MAKRDFVEYHIVETLLGALVEADGDENLSRRLRAEAKLWATASEWVNQLVERPTPDKEGKDDR